MEWYGIDLSGATQRKWQMSAYRSLKYALWLLVGLAAGSWLLVQDDLQKNAKIRPLVSRLATLEQDVVRLEQKITVLQSDHQPSLPFADSGQVGQFLTLIKELPLKNGGLNGLQLYVENGLYLKLQGKLSEQTDFQQLEKYLKQQSFSELKTDQIKLNNKNETDFIFSLKHKGN